jgi:hypothetical protein
MTFAKKSWIFPALAIGVLALSAADPGSAYPAAADHTAARSTRTAACPTLLSCELDGVSAVSPGTAFAVGWHHLDNYGITTEWNGKRWSRAARSAGWGSLGSVDALSESDAWAVGWAGRPFMQHWDGQQWSEVDNGLSGERDTDPLAVTMVSPNDVWAVGYYEIGEGLIKTAILHWDGSTWTRVASPNTDGDYNELTSISAVSADDIWAVGEARGPFMVHWDGTAWSAVGTPQGRFLHPSLRSISVVSADDVWAVGDGFDPNTGNVRGVIEHWDGHSWSIVRSPSPGALGNRLMSVSAVSADDVWAVGWTFDGPTGYPGRSLIEHWNGHRWRPVPSPHPGQDFDGLTAVSADTSDDAWAVGSFGAGDPFTQSEMMAVHWDGTTWHRVHLRT